MAEFPAPKEAIALTHFIVSDDVERSRRFYKPGSRADEFRSPPETKAAGACDRLAVSGTHR
jgi:hypothetical protein